MPDTGESRAAPALALMSGSLRAASLNTSVLRAAARIITDATSGQVRVITVDIGGMPHFNADLDAGALPAVNRFLASLAQADGLLIATPEYNGYPSGALKNALDWATRDAADGPLSGLPTSTVSASPGERGGSFAQRHLREMLRRCGAVVVGDPVAISRASAAVSADGEFTDPGTCARIADAAMTLLTVCLDRRQAVPR